MTFEQKLGGGGALSSLKGDFEGKGAYGEELLAGTGYTLDVAAPDGRHLASSAEAQDSALSVKIVSKGPATASILVEGLSAGGASESWALTLNSGDRGGREQAEQHRAARPDRVCLGPGVESVAEQRAHA